MITIEVEYPWGKRDIEYESWIYKSITYAYNDKEKEWKASANGVSEVRATDQKMYENILRCFTNNKEDSILDYGDKNVVTCNSHYYEVIYSPKEKTVFYIQGFLK